MAKVIHDNYNFFEKGVTKQVDARTPRKAVAEFSYSCIMCPKGTCAEENCAIKIAHNVAIEGRLSNKADTFFNNGVEVQKKAFNIGYATKQYTYSCDKCEHHGYDIYMSCEDCPIRKEYEKNIRTLK